MQSFEIPLGEWLPDQADYKNPGLVEAENCYPSSGGYAPFEIANATADTTTETVRGAELFIRNDGTPLVCAGSSTRLLVRNASGVTETTGYTALASASVWNFERFNDLVIAVSPENDPQYLTDIDTDTGWSALPGSPPKAAVVAKVSDWLVMGDLTDIAGLGSPVVPHRVRWGAFNNPTTSWVTDRGELSDFRDLNPKYGKITGIVGGRSGLVFQERAIWRMVFVGAPKVFEFEEVLVDRGCTAPQSIVTIGFETFFLSQDGFCVTNGSDVNNISSSRNAEWFVANVDNALLSRTHGAVNWPKRCIVWAFIPSTGADFAREMIYSFVENKWSAADQEVDYLVQTKSDALTLADLAVLFPGGLGTMSAYELGTSEWKARDRAMAAFTVSGSGSVFSPFNGANAQADFVTGDLNVIPGKRSRVTGIRPIIENADGTTTTSVRARERQGAGVTATTPTTQGADGYCPHNKDSWFHSGRMTVPAGASWDKASGMVFRAAPTGVR